MSAHESEPTRQTRACCGTAPSVLEGARILVVDDDADSCGAVAAVLARAGAQVKTAGGGMEALGLLRNWKPSLIVTDLMMPAGNGYFLIARARARREGSAVPVVALSGAAASSDRERTRAAGFDAHLAKPVSADELIAVLSDLWRTSRPS